MNSADLPWTARAPLSELGGDAQLLEGRADAYRRFLATNARGDDSYLFTDARARFTADDTDIVLAMSGLDVRADASGASVGARNLHERVAVPGVGPRKLELLLASLDGERTLADARRKAQLTDAEHESVLAACFGVVLFAPLAVLELERRISGVEIVRFPGSPYEVTRSYWRNMASVRERSHALDQRLGSVAGALAELRRLHAISLLGAETPSFYRPASPVAEKGVGPGELWLDGTVTEAGARGVRFVSGPRVNATFLGGERYGALLCESVADPDAQGERVLRGADGLEWGRVLFGSADHDLEARPWFCPPRPLDAAHFESTFGSLARALASADDQDEQLSALAAFHQKYVRLHPFRASNQGLAMNLVNRVLLRSQGAGIPHLLLDHLALRLSESAYARVFRRAVGAWTVAGAPAARLTALSERKRAFFELIHALTLAGGMDEARALASASPAAARAALLLD
jgi:hypothetical protein